MPKTADLSILLKKTGARPVERGTSAPSPLKAMRKAVSRAAQDTGELIASVTGLNEAQISLADIVADLPETALLVMLMGPEEMRGLAIVEEQIISGVLEQLTTGRVAPRPTEPRSPTRTDGVLVSDFLDRILGLFDQGIETLPSVPPVRGFRTDGTLPDKRSVGLAFEDLLYRRYGLTIDLGSGAKTGQVTFIFPWSTASIEFQSELERKQWRKTLKRSVNRAQVQLNAVLYRKKIPLSKLREWTVGLEFEIPKTAIVNVSVEGIDGTRVAKAKLGQVEGRRAIRLEMVKRSNGPVQEFQTAATPSQLPEVPVEEANVNAP